MGKLHGVEDIDGMDGDAGPSRVVYQGPWNRCIMHRSVTKSTWHPAIVNTDVNDNRKHPKQLSIDRGSTTTIYRCPVDFDISIQSDTLPSYLLPTASYH